eukprot:jgi/Botrbrau1/9903/Bobra.0012s0006.1
MWLHFRDRLANESNNGAVEMKTMTAHGDHQAMITQPHNVAAALLDIAQDIYATSELTE